MDRVRALSLKGGVLVASITEGSTSPEPVVSSVIEAMRGELRSSDMLAQLEGGEVAALLVRSSADGVVLAADRVRKRLERLARERRMPPVRLGPTLYPSEGADSLAALVARAKSRPAADLLEGWRLVG
jgi:GGDEF domain-containing protein